MSYFTRIKQCLLLFSLIAASCTRDKNTQPENMQGEQKDSAMVEHAHKEGVHWSGEKTTTWNHRINWFEIPVSDFTRAKIFYESILNIKIEEHSDTSMGGYTMGFLGGDEKDQIVTGALVLSKDCIPSDKGTLIYLNANPDLNIIIERINKAGGKIIMPKTFIAPEIGHMSMFIDSEGNKLALHSKN